MTNQQSTERGSLYIVATPIGNKDDITHRALHTLQSVDYILAEDTRHTLQLLNTLGIKNSLHSFHAHNESEKSQSIIDDLLKGKSIALVSDAGTPLISDPGYPLVKMARQNQITVIPIPGPSAMITALSAAGVPCDTFLFLGFLPAKQVARKKKLASFVHQPYTLVFYESTHRIVDCLNDLIEVFGAESSMVLAKELTKSYETFIEGSTFDVRNWLLSDAGHTKGEFVLIIHPRTITENIRADEELLTVLLRELPLKQAITIASQLTQTKKNELYEIGLKIKNLNAN